MTRKEPIQGNPHTRGIDWPTKEGQAASGNCPRKEGKRRAGVGTLGAKKNPAGVNLRGLAGVIGLLTVPGKGGENEKEGE